MYIDCIFQSASRPLWNHFTYFDALFLAELRGLFLVFFFVLLFGLLAVLLLEADVGVPLPSVACCIIAASRALDLV